MSRTRLWPAAKIRLFESFQGEVLETRPHHASFVNFLSIARKAFVPRFVRSFPMHIKANPGSSRVNAIAGSKAYLSCFLSNFYISPHCAIVTSRSGTSLPRRPVLVASIFFTTSMPSTTRPKTTCLPSRNGVGTVVMKNWEPLVLGPAFCFRNVVLAIWIRAHFLLVQMGA